MWSEIRPGPDLVRICQIWDRNGNGSGFSVVTNIVFVSNTIHLYIKYSNTIISKGILYKMHACYAF